MTLGPLGRRYAIARLFSGQTGCKLNSLPLQLGMLTLLRSGALRADKLDRPLLQRFCLFLLGTFWLQHRLVYLQIVLRRAASEDDLEVELICQILHERLVIGLLEERREAEHLPAAVLLHAKDRRCSLSYCRSQGTIFAIPLASRVS